MKKEEESLIAFCLYLILDVLACKWKTLGLISGLEFRHILIVPKEKQGSKTELRISQYPRLRCVRVAPKP